jgi:hypothetical protein
LQRVEDGAELVERIFDQTRLCSRFVACGGDLHKNRKQISRLAGLTERGGFVARFAVIEPVQIRAQPIE